MKFEVAFTIASIDIRLVVALTKQRDDKDVMANETIK